MPETPPPDSPTPDAQPNGPLGRRAFLWLLVLFLFVPMVCCGGCSIILSLLQGPPAVQSSD